MNTTAKHTPGPWRVSKSGAAIDLPDGCQVRLIRARVETHAANAALIAAAPELLAQLIAVTCQLERAQYELGLDLEEVRAARSTIAKAENRS